MHFIQDSLAYPVPLFLKRQCDRTLGAAWARAGLGPGTVILRQQHRQVADPAFVARLAVGESVIERWYSSERAQ